MITRPMENLAAFDDYEELTAGPDIVDSSAYLRMLEKAEEDHHLDGRGILEKLAEAVRGCTRLAKFHNDSASGYLLAKCMYLAEAHRRNALPRAATGAGHAGGGFKGWCREHGFSYNNANNLALIGNSPTPLAALVRFTRNRRIYKKRDSVRRRLGNKVIRSPLEASKDLWGRLSERQRLEFLDWLLENGSNDRALIRIAVPAIAASFDPAPRSAA